MPRITSTIPPATAPGNEVAPREQHRPERAPAPAWQGVPQDEALRRRSPQREEANAAMPPQQSISTMPPELLSKLRSQITAPRDKAHFALANAEVLSATLPASHDKEVAHLRELARCANDIKSFMLVLDQERRFPDTSRADLLTELAGKVADIAKWATSSHEHIQAAAPNAERSFRKLSGRIAELPRRLQAEPLFVLGRQLGALMPTDRLGAMDAILTATQGAASSPQRIELLNHLSTRLNQFPSRDTQSAVQRLLDEAPHLSDAQRRSMCNALRSGLAGVKVPADHQATIKGAIDQVSPSAPVERPRGRDFLQFSRLAR